MLTVKYGGREMSLPWNDGMTYGGLKDSIESAYNADIPENVVITADGNEVGEDDYVGNTVSVVTIAAEAGKKGC